MVATYLIISANNPQQEQIQKEIKNSAADTDILLIQSVESKAIGIEKSRELIKFSQKRPLSGDQKLAIVYDAHKMTEEAQNALLKTLEEHGDFVDIVLVAKNENGLLDTVISRCKKLAVMDKGDKNSKKSEKNKELLKELKSLNFGEKLGFAQKISKMEKEEIVALLEEWAELEEKDGFYENAELFLRCAEDLDKLNVNGRLLLETSFLELRS